MGSPAIWSLPFHRVVPPCMNSGNVHEHVAGKPRKLVGRQMADPRAPLMNVGIALTAPNGSCMRLTGGRQPPMPAT